MSVLFTLFSLVFRLFDLSVVSSIKFSTRSRYRSSHRGPGRRTSSGPLNKSLRLRVRGQSGFLTL